MDLPRIYDQLILAASIAISIAVAVFSWRRRPVVAAASLSFLMSGVAIWSLSDLLQILTPDFEGKLFWSKICYLGIVLIPAAWIIFILQYTGQDRILTRRNLALLSIEPIATLIFAFTNEYHGLLWSHINRQTLGPFVTAGAVYGLWFWVHAAYSYLLL
ncbi:MAG: hypothetical protein LUO89_00380, partial [Methanothrix sp.]|nr:hypothetical protein [Methanothrix sp.]